jgi:hypothetical protein
MEVVYDRPTQRVYVCVECHTSLTVPATALDIRRIKRNSSTDTK